MSAEEDADADRLGGCGCLSIVALITAFFHPLIAVGIFCWAICTAFPRLYQGKPSRRLDIDVPEIVGESFHQEHIRRLSTLSPVSSRGVEVQVMATFVEEPENRHDAGAIAVYVDDQRVGYISRNYPTAKKDHLRRKIREGKATVRAIIAGGPSPERPRAKYGVFIVQSPFGGQ